VFRLTSMPEAERLTAIRQHQRAVLVFGPGLSATGVTAVLDALAPASCTSIVLGATGVAAFQELIDADRLFYLSRGELSPRDLDALIDSALQVPREDVALDRFLSADQLRRMALAQSVPELADAVCGAAARAVAAERTRCVLFDRERQVLWTPNESDGESAAVGLVSFILRTGLTLCFPRAGDDPRFDRELDAPGGEATDRFLGVAVRAGRGEIVAVLVALRPAREAAFEPREIAALETVAAHASPYLSAWLLEQEGAGPYRHRALRELEQPMASGPEPLRLDSRWMKRASWLAIATVIVLALALVFVRVPEYASGTGVVRDDGAVVVTFAAGVPVEPGMPLRFNQQTLPIESVAVSGNRIVAVTATQPRASAGTRGKAEVRVGTTRLLFALKGERRNG
jgi:hypothetical protein